MLTLIRTPIQATRRYNRIGKRHLSLRNSGNRNLDAANADRKFGALASRRVRRTPPDPCFIHAGKIIFVRKHDGCADDFVDELPATSPWPVLRCFRARLYWATGASTIVQLLMLVSVTVWIQMVRSARRMT